MKTVYESGPSSKWKLIPPPPFLPPSPTSPHPLLPFHYAQSLSRPGECCMKYEGKGKRKDMIFKALGLLESQLLRLIFYSVGYKIEIPVNSLFLSLYIPGFGWRWVAFLYKGLISHMVWRVQAQGSLPRRGLQRQSYLCKNWVLLIHFKLVVVKFLKRVVVEENFWPRHLAASLLKGQFGSLAEFCLFVLVASLFG